MTPRQAAEVELLRRRYPALILHEADGVWIRLNTFKIPGPWAQPEYDICFCLNPVYPDTKPYGFYAQPFPRGGPDNQSAPGSYQDNGDPKPPFEGQWGKFSWDLPEWRPSPDVQAGSNLVNWVESFRSRFNEGP